MDQTACNPSGIFKLESNEEKIISAVGLVKYSDLPEL